MDLGIAGRTALVGGASSGLGRASAAALAAEGCRLAIWSRGGAGLEAVATDLRERYGTEVTVLTGDAAVEGTAARIAAEATEALGTIDILVLNAGGPPPVDPTATERAGWERAFQLLSITPIELATELLPGMRARRWGRVVAILSSGVRQPIPDLVYSNAARGALMAWLKTTARAVAADEVTVNGVMPGRLQTPRIDSLDRGRADKTGETLEAVRAGHLAAIPAGRYGRPGGAGRVRGLPVLRPRRLPDGHVHRDRRGPDRRPALSHGPGQAGSTSIGVPDGQVAVVEEASTQPGPVDERPEDRPADELLHVGARLAQLDALDPHAADPERAPDQLVEPDAPGGQVPAGRPRLEADPVLGGEPVELLGLDERDLADLGRVLLGDRERIAVTGQPDAGDRGHALDGTHRPTFAVCEVDRLERARISRRHASPTVSRIGRSRPPPQTTRSQAARRSRRAGRRPARG